MVPVRVDAAELAVALVKLFPEMRERDVSEVVDRPPSLT